MRGKKLGAKKMQNFLFSTNVQPQLFG